MTAHLALRGAAASASGSGRPPTTHPGGVGLGVPAGKPISVRDLLYSLILHSGNDAAQTLARGSRASVPAFVPR